ncbi:hypothetical protein BM7_CDS0136 [Klebsiella phage Kpn BM7]|nr:hypothetical protein BM7_CDS0136 [Klebsiella phage Kpn BM7]
MTIAFLILIAYLVIGIGYGKTLVALDDGSAQGTVFIAGFLFWPIALIIASFWNFK